jgi:ferredoxin
LPAVVLPVFQVQIEDAWTTVQTAQTLQTIFGAADVVLLRSLEQAGISWPSSCRNGHCRACIGQLAKGSVRYEIAWPGLSAEEKMQGVILPCVAYPQSDLCLRLGMSD